MNRLWKPAPLAISVITLGMTFLTMGCGSGGTQVRLLFADNNCTSCSVNMLVNNSAVASGVTFGSASGYASAASGSQTVVVQSGGVTVASSNGLNISGGNNNTILATQLGLTDFVDNRSEPATNQVQIRAINASPSIVPSADVYIVASGTDISTVSPTATLNFQAATTYQTVAAGNYQVEFCPAGTKIPLVNTTLQLTSQQIRTVVSLDGNGYQGLELADLN